MKLGRVALDGSKVKANASKHKAMSYGRMQEEEKRLKEEVKRLLEQAEATDAEEDTRYGRDRTGDELPAELARRETRLKRIQEAKRAPWKSAHARKPRVRASRRRRPSPKPRCNITSLIQSRASCLGPTDLCRPTTHRLRWNRISSGSWGRG
jgi:spore cortex formation protein SpoVR/YcgB (stage V sporulation)